MNLVELIDLLEAIRKTTTGESARVMIDIDYGKKNNCITCVSHEFRYSPDGRKEENVIIHN